MAEKWVVLCVHGVGDSKPADMVDAVAPTVCAVSGAVLPTPDQYEMVRLPDDKGATFPVFMRRTAFGPSKVLFAELFWADLSRSKPGLVGFLTALFLLVFGIRHLADQASAQPGAAARVLRALLLTVANLLRGPLFALYLLASAYALIYLAAWKFGLFDLRAAPSSGAAFALLGVLAVVLGFRLWRESRRQVLLSSTPWYSLAVVGILALAAAAASLAGRVDLHDAAQNAALPAPIRWPSDRFRAEFTNVGSTDEADFYLAATVWLGNAVLAAISALMLAALVPLACVWLRGPAGLRRALAAAYLAEGMQIALWVLIVTPFNWLITATLTMRLAGTAGALYWTDFTNAASLQVCFFMLIVTAAIAVWAARLRWAGRSTPDGWNPTHPAPRLIVGLPILLAVLACSLIFFVFTLWAAYYPNTILFPVFVAGVVISFASGAVLLGLLFWQGPIRFGLHVVTDVISHFQRKGARFPLRERIQARFHQALCRLLDVEDPSHVLLVAHSQGTIITLESLLDPELAARLRGRAVALATFGSPFTDLYQHYFPAQYGPLNEGAWTRLDETVGRWVNLFRIDDYVGTNVNGPKETWPTNVPLPPGFALAHTSYWEEAIFRRIAAELPPAAPHGHPTLAPPASS